MWSCLLKYILASIQVPVLSDAGKEEQSRELGRPATRQATEISSHSVIQFDSFLWISQGERIKLHRGSNLNSAVDHFCSTYPTLSFGETGVYPRGLGAQSGGHPGHKVPTYCRPQSHTMNNLDIKSADNTSLDWERKLENPKKTLQTQGGCRNWFPNPSGAMQAFLSSRVHDHENATATMARGSRDYTWHALRVGGKTYAFFTIYYSDTSQS